MDVSSFERDELRRLVETLPFSDDELMQGVHIH